MFPLDLAEEVLLVGWAKPMEGLPLFLVFGVHVLDVWDVVFFCV